jgi:hypothetical protein
VACLLAIVPAVMLARNYYASATLYSDSATTVYLMFAIWCALMAVSMASWPGRLAAGGGALLAGILVWARGPLPDYPDLPDLHMVHPGIGPSVVVVVLSGAMFGGIGSAVRYRASWLVRAAACLGMFGLLAPVEPPVEILRIAQDLRAYSGEHLPGPLWEVLHAYPLGSWDDTGPPIWGLPISVAQVLIAGVALAGIIRIVSIALQVLRARIRDAAGGCLKVRTR